MKQVERPPTLTSAVVSAIRDTILRGEILPGAPLHEENLSQSLNISRGTVREALRQLQSEGMVEVFPYRGAFVTRLSIEKIKEIYTLRALVEPYAVRLSLENHCYTAEDFREMRSLIEQMGVHEADGSYSEMITADIQFHHLISRACNHELLLNVINSLQSLTLLFILNTKLYQSDMIRDDASHTAILESMLSGDPQQAESVLRQHITDAGTSLLKRMAQIA